MKAGWLKFAYIKHLSQPAKDRLIYRLIDGGNIRSITEFGLGAGIRTQWMIEFALRHYSPDQIRYVGFDLFESRPTDQPGLSLKQAHRMLSATGVSFRLVPGDVGAGLNRNANVLANTDLLIISGDVDHGSLESGWLYFPRMMREESIVLLESGNVQPAFQRLSLPQIAELARRSSTAAKRAA